MNKTKFGTIATAVMAVGGVAGFIAGKAACKAIKSRKSGEDIAIGAICVGSVDELKNEFTADTLKKTLDLFIKSSGKRGNEFGFCVGDTDYAVRDYSVQLELLDTEDFGDVMSDAKESEIVRCRNGAKYMYQRATDSEYLRAPLDSTLEWVEFHFKYCGKRVGVTMYFLPIAETQELDEQVIELFRTVMISLIKGQKDA